MGELIVTFEILPESVETDIETVKKELTKIISEELKQEGKPLTNQKHEIKEFVFGMKKIESVVVFDEDKVRTEDLIQKLSEIKGVNSVRVVRETRNFLG